MRNMNTVELGTIMYVLGHFIYHGGKITNISLDLSGFPYSNL